jgi:hypothetical protein
MWYKKVKNQKILQVPRGWKSGEFYYEKWNQPSFNFPNRFFLTFAASSPLQKVVFFNVMLWASPYIGKSGTLPEKYPRYAAKVGLWC